MWETVAITGGHANLRREIHDYVAGETYKRHRRLGFVVTLLTTIVGTSVFAALTQDFSTVQFYKAF
jgi:hypothetical protein